MTESSPAEHPSPDAKDFLLEEYKSLSKALEVNEEIGETRVNWLIGIVTAVLGGVVAMATAEKASLPERTRETIAICFLLGLLILGYITLRRILKRNATTDGFKKDLRRIRDIFRDHYDPNRVLIGYQGFAGGGSRKKKKAGRKYGGLADLVSALNSLIIAVLAATMSSFKGDSLTDTAVVGVAAFVLSALAQRLYVQASHQKIHKKLRDPVPTHAGGVVVDFRDGVLKYLVAQPSDGSDRWILPKGKIKEGEDPREAALREVAEETGVRARLRRPLPTIEYSIKDKTIWAKFYLMEPIFEGKPIEREVVRRKAWISFDQAMEALPDEAKELLVIAERRALASFGRSASL
jgi:8-oxo-dGTP pyrophosphatase MutT (NUDIX family)